MDLPSPVLEKFAEGWLLSHSPILRLCWGYVDLTHHLCYWVWIDWKIARILHLVHRRIILIIFHTIRFLLSFEGGILKEAVFLIRWGLLAYSLMGLQAKYTPNMIFVTQTKIGTMVKRVPQEQMVGVRSYPFRELFSPFSGFVMLVSFRDVLDFKFL